MVNIKDMTCNGSVTNVLQHEDIKTQKSMKLDQVTPELAAQIVKYYVIPMFDTDIKKSLRKK